MKKGTPRAAKLAGRVFSNLTVIKRFGTRWTCAQWLCKCVCGRKIKAVTSDLTSGHVRSCGCLRADSTWKNSPLEYGIWSSAKYRARQKGVPFSIQVSDIKIPPFCPIFGTPFFLGKGGPRNESPSIDRIYPDKGYIPGNIAIVSFKANRIKNECSPDELIELALKFKGLVQ